jgi:hypothetical protein
VLPSDCADCQGHLILQSPQLLGISLAISLAIMHLGKLRA